MRRWPRWSFAASAEKRTPHKRERRRAGKCSSRGGGFAYCALDGMRRQLPRAPTPVPDLQPARYNLSPANNSRSYNSRQGMPRQREQTPSIRIISALSETCQTSIYGLASRVILRGSKWNRHCRLRTIGDLPGSNLWPDRSCDTRRQQVEPAQPARIRRFFFVAFAA